MATLDRESRIENSKRKGLIAAPIAPSPTGYLHIGASYFTIRRCSPMRPAGTSHSVMRSESWGRLRTAGAHRDGFAARTCLTTTRYGMGECIWASATMLPRKARIANAATP